MRLMQVACQSERNKTSFTLFTSIKSYPYATYTIPMHAFSCLIHHHILNFLLYTVFVLSYLIPYLFFVYVQIESNFLCGFNFNSCEIFLTSSRAMNEGGLIQQDVCMLFACINTGMFSPFNYFCINIRLFITLGFHQFPTFLLISSSFNIRND